MTDEEIRQIAEKTATLLARSMFRMAPGAKEICDSAADQQWSWPVGNGAFAGVMNITVLADGIMLQLKAADGSQLWEGRLFL